METIGKRLWLVGGSSGIGLELAKLLLNNSFKLVISSRQASLNKELQKLKNLHTNSAYLLDFDVTLKTDVKNIVEEAWNVYDGLDIWFYNAGAYEIMDINSWDFKKFEILNNTNYLGAVSIMTEISKYFIKQKSGRWLWNLSLSSYFGLPKGGAYCAPKAALLNLAQALQPELIQYNIKLQVINHGFVKTRLTKKNTFDMPQLMEPDFAAKKIFEAIKKEEDLFEIRFPTKLRLFLQFLSFIPYKLSLSITKRMLNES